jgi:cytochrome c biogenesis protein CcdA
MTNLPLPIAAFVAGLISFLSPCVLPLVPGYVSLISGAGVEELKSSDGHLLRKVMLNSAAFIIGFSIVFITLGAISTEVGQVLAQYKSLLSRIAGAVIILFGLHLTGIFQIKALLADTRLHALKGGASPWGAFVMASLSLSDGRHVLGRSWRLFLDSQLRRIPSGRELCCLQSIQRGWLSLLFSLPSASSVF